MVTRKFGVKGFTAYIQDVVNDHVHRNTPHYHNGYELLYFMEGESHIVINGREYRATTGDLAIYHPDMVHDERVQPGPFRIICLRFEKKDVSVPIPGEDDLAPVIHLPWPERFQQVFEQIVIENQGVDRWSKALVGTYMVQFAALLWRALSDCEKNLDDRNGHNASRIAAVINLLNSRLGEDVSLGQLADRAYMSESHFSHVFKDVTGISPKRYVIRRKLEKARRMLSRTDLSVTEISTQLGYESPQYFSRVFKRACHCTPLQYRQNSRKVH